MIALEKERISFSPEVERKLAETFSEAEAREQLEKVITPECPDGSGEIGHYSSEATKWFGGSATYVTETKKYFHWWENVQKGSLISPTRIPPHLR